MVRRLIMNSKSRSFSSTGKENCRIILRLILACLVILLCFSASACDQLEDVSPLLERLIGKFRDNNNAAVFPEDEKEEELTLILYFADNQAVDNTAGGLYGFVMPVARSLSITDDPLTAAITELITGPQPEDGNMGRTVPETATLEEIGINEGTAVLNFNRKFASDHPGGVLGTQITVESLVYTATEFTAVDRVQVLVEGNPWADGYGFVWNMPIDVSV